jgi:hypothetical protein
MADPPRLQVDPRAVRHAVRALERGRDERSLEAELRGLGLSKTAAMAAIAAAKRGLR